MFIGPKLRRYSFIGNWKKMKPFQCNSLLLIHLRAQKQKSFKIRKKTATYTIRTREDQN